MRNTILSTIMVLCLSSCNSSVPSNTEKAISEPIEQSSASFEKLNIEKLLVPVEAIANGERVASIAWKDQNGKNILVAYQHTEGQPFDDDFVSELHLKCVVMQDEGTKLLWEHKEASPNIYSDIELLDGGLKVEDLDKDGIGEPRFFYAITPDGLDPATLKYVIRYKDEYLAIEGQLPAELEGFDERYEKNISADFDKHPPIFKEIASKEWDAYVAEEKEELE